MSLLTEAQAMRTELQSVRRAIHREPEVGLDLPRTQERVLDELADLPVDVSVGKATTSITAIVRGTAAGRPTHEAAAPSVLLRADMDALPIVEETGLEYASVNGCMHACGHDLHTAGLIGAARLLCRHRHEFTGDVVLAFQPGEEGWGGAKIMLDEGVLESPGRRVDAAYALHVAADLERTGAFYSRPGIILSASYKLSVEVRGAGGHGSSPHTAADPVAAMAEMVTALQIMVTRTFDVFDPVVITVACVEAGSRHNIIPSRASFEATVRCYSDATLEAVPGAIERVLHGVAAAHRVDVGVHIDPEFPVTVNDDVELAFAEQVVADHVGGDSYEGLQRPVSASEDFAYILNEVPGAFMMLGACAPGRDPATAPMNHSPLVQFDDAVVAEAATLYAGLALERLELGSPRGDGATNE